MIDVEFLAGVGGRTSPARIRAIRRSTAASLLKSIDRACTMCSVLAAGDRRSAVGGEVDRRVDDVDLAAGRCRMRRRWPKPGPSSRSPGFRTPSEWRRCCPRGRGSRRRARSRRRHARRGLRSGEPAHAAGRRLGLPNEPTQLFALTFPPWLARTVTGQLHSTPLSDSRPTRLKRNEQAPTNVPFIALALWCFRSHRQRFCITGATNPILQGPSNPLSTSQFWLIVAAHPPCRCRHTGR